MSNSQIWDSTYDIHLDAGHPLPVLVGEILSDSTVVRDLEGKRKLYKTLDITEYVPCDVLGGLLDPHDAGMPRMSVYCLQPDGRYALAPIDPLLSEAAMPACDSGVLGTCVRLQGPRDPLNALEDARFQWWDAERNCWRDPVTDQEQERLAEAVGTVRLFLGNVLPPAVLDRIESAWHRHGPPRLEPPGAALCPAAGHAKCRTSALVQWRGSMMARRAGNFPERPGLRLLFRRQAPW